MNDKYIYFFYQKKLKNRRWIPQEARISRIELESLIRKMIGKKEIFDEIKRILRGG